MTSHEVVRQAAIDAFDLAATFAPEAAASINRAKHFWLEGFDASAKASKT
jgi:hypothetical protein